MLLDELLQLLDPVLLLHDEYGGRGGEDEIKTDFPDNKTTQSHDDKLLNN